MTPSGIVGLIAVQTRAFGPQVISVYSELVANTAEECLRECARLTDAVETSVSPSSTSVPCIPTTTFIWRETPQPGNFAQVPTQSTLIQRMLYDTRHNMVNTLPYASESGW